MSGRFLLFVITATLLCACGPDEDPPPNIIDGSNTPNNTTNNTTGTNNATNNLILNNGFGEECLGVECMADQRCVRGTCVAASSKVSCEDFEDIGELEADTTYMGSGDTAGYADAIATICPSEGLYSGAENAIKFTVASAGGAEFSVSTSDPIDWLMEVREDCSDPGMDPPDNNEPMPGDLARAQCSNSASLSFTVRPGRDYWLIVEPAAGAIDTGTFEWTLDLGPARLCSVGRTCQDATTVLQCFAGVEERVLSCGTTCTNGSCAGDLCTNALEVTAAMSWSGDADAFTSFFDFADQTSCSMDGVEGIATPGPDMVLSLPGLTAGQRVSVDASMMDDNDNAIFVLDSCDVNSGCLAGRDLGDKLDFDVPADGDYFVVIDKLTNSTHTFNYTIDIQ